MTMDQGLTRPGSTVVVAETHLRTCHDRKVCGIYAVCVGVVTRESHPKECLSIRNLTNILRETPSKSNLPKPSYSQWIDDAEADLKRARREFSDEEYRHAIERLQAGEEKLAKGILLGIRFITNPSSDEPLNVPLKDVLDKDFRRFGPEYFGHNWHDKFFNVGAGLHRRELRLKGEDTGSLEAKIDDLKAYVRTNPNPSEEDVMGWVEVGKSICGYYRSSRARKRYKSEKEMHQFLGLWAMIYNLEILAPLNSYLWKHHTATYPNDNPLIIYDTSTPLIKLINDIVIYLNNIIIIAREVMPDIHDFLATGTDDPATKSSSSK